MLEKSLLEQDWAELIAWFCLVVAETSAPRTVYHSRIDGLILPARDPIARSDLWR